MNRRIIIEILLLVLLNFIIFFNTLDNDFIWDDFMYIIDNPAVKTLSWQNIYHIFNVRNTWWMESSRMYTPLTVLSFALSFSIGAGKPFFFHLTNIIINILNSILIYYLVTIWTREKNIAIATALIFSVLPVHTEAVAWISSEKDLLSGFFYLASLIIFHKYLMTKSWPLYTASLLVFLLALLSKPAAISLPFVMLCYELIIAKRAHGDKIYLRYVPFFVLSAAAVFIHIIITQNDLYHLNFRYEHIGLLEKIITLLLMCGKYVGMIVYPFNISVIYINPHDIHNIPLFQTVIFSLVAFVMLFTAFYQRKKNSLLTFAILWFFVVLFPNLSKYTTNASMAARYIYLPSLGICLMIALILFRLYTINRFSRFVVPCVFLIIMLTCSAQTVALNNVYQNSVTFWQNAFRTYPNNPLIFNNLSLAYENEGNYDEEIKMLYKWISYDDKNYIAYIRLGDALEKKSLHEEAVKAYKEAVNLKPGDSEGYVRLGAVYYYTQQYELSYKAYRKALNIDPALSKVRKFLLFMKQAKLIDSATSEDNN